MTRSDLAASFIASAGWSGANVTQLAGDASNRRYDRLTAQDGRTAVLMDAPPDKGEDVQPFVRIAEFLGGIGLSAPRILHQDITAGFLLIEDLGDRLFAREMAADPAMELPLYRAAVDVLLHLHRATPPVLESYASDKTAALAALAYDWYLFGVSQDVNDRARSAFLASFRPVLADFDDALTVLIQRDYHAENLLWLPERSGVARVGLLDFQDAMLGHPAYDLVSILQDARRDVSPEIAQEMKREFIARGGHDATQFETAYAVFGLQRSLRILGVFARLCMRDGKMHYVDLIPRVWEHLLSNLAHPALAQIRDLIVRDLPAPTAELQTKLKGQCGQWAGR
jgi:aminoglycoside/choline kinase family phosphotransferase